MKAKAPCKKVETLEPMFLTINHMCNRLLSTIYDRAANELSPTDEGCHFKFGSDDDQTAAKLTPVQVIDAVSEYIVHNMIGYFHGSHLHDLR